VNHVLIVNDEIHFFSFFFSPFTVSHSNSQNEQLIQHWSRITGDY